jgi:hypothetical protein
MAIPTLTREIDVYWGRGLDVRRRNVGGKETILESRRGSGDTEVLVRRVRLPRKVWFERNVLGLWSELWVERV